MFVHSNAQATFASEACVLNSYYKHFYKYPFVLCLRSVYKSNLPNMISSIQPFEYPDELFRYIYIYILNNYLNLLPSPVTIRMYSLFLSY